MNTRSQSLKNGALALTIFGFVLLVVGPTMLGSDDAFTNTIGTCMFAAGAVFLLAGLIYGGLAILAREPQPVAPVQQPQAYYPPQV